MIDFINSISQATLPWFKMHGTAILVVLLVAWLIRRFSGFFIEQGIRKAVVPDSHASPEAEKKREDTLIKIAQGTLSIVIWIVAIMMILSEAGIDIGPMIAAAGVVGLAFGFGGQYLIRDIIAGLFFVFENQFRVGDVVCFGDTCGLVEHLTLRTSTLRDLDGKVHHVPHGEVGHVTNLSKDFARVNINIGIGYDSDLEHVMNVINDIGDKMKKDSEWSDKIIKAPQFLRVENFGDSAIDIKILGETKPLEQWAVTGELKKRIKIAFDKEGIKIPFPQRVIHKAED
jgi:moderate conductance mechanosensitive channel